MRYGGPAEPRPATRSPATTTFPTRHEENPVNRSIRTATLTATVLGALLLTACEDTASDDDSAKPKKAPSSSTPAPATTSAFLRPTPAQETALIKRLSAIDAGLTVNKERAVRRSVSVCDDIRTGKDGATVVKNAAYRYDGGNASVGNAKATKIVAAIKASYCKA